MIFYGTGNNKMADIKPNNQAALSFLKRWAPQGPWVLTALHVDRKGIVTKTFFDGQEQDMVQFIMSHNGKRNLYFHVNPTSKDLKKKAEREDIKELAWLHVDVDPRAGEDLYEEQRRCLQLFTEKLPTGIPEPTVVIFSGGGYQGFWKLDTPIPINGDLAIAEDVKRYNQQLEIMFGADNCHNIDRIMRLPGSINIPDIRKLKKGRVPALAEVIIFNDYSYPISDFTVAPTVQMADDIGFASGAAPLVKISNNVDRVLDLSELDQWSVPDRVKVIIAQGMHPDEKKQGDDSRSAWLFDCICNLTRCGVPDETIYAIITDPEYSISDSVLDKGTNATKYALRQIGRGKEEAIEPWLRILNEKHAVVRTIGGQCRVIEELWDEGLQRTRLSRQSIGDFKAFYQNVPVTVGIGANGMPQTKKLGDFWISHIQRRQYDTIVFAPGREVPNCYNMWKGFACLSRPGDCSLFLDHVFNNICGKNNEFYTYLINWMARAVQNPATCGSVAIVLRGGRGTGKSFFAKVFGHLFGRHFLQISNPSHLVGNFNSHLRDVIVLFADEAFYAGDKKHSSILKTLITEETITIEAKGVDAEAAPNYVHLIMASNDDHVVPAGGDERRFFVLDVGEGSKQDAKYFAAIAKQLKEGGYEALLHYLMTYDISEFQVFNVPKTEALHEQKLLSLSPEEDWWYHRLMEGSQLRNGDEWSISIVKNDVIGDYVEHVRRFNISRRGSETALGKFLHKLHPCMRSEQRMTAWQEPTFDGYTLEKQGRKYFWFFPPLEEARKQWEDRYGKEKWTTPAPFTPLKRNHEPF